MVKGPILVGDGHEPNIKGILAAPPKATPPSNKGLIFGPIKGNRWLINPDHKAGYFLGGVALGGGGVVRIPMTIAIYTPIIHNSEFRYLGCFSPQPPGMPKNIKKS